MPGVGFVHQQTITGPLTKAGQRGRQDREGECITVRVSRRKELGMDANLHSEFPATGPC